MIYWLTVCFFRIFVRLYFRGRAWGKEHLPDHGPYVAVINHNSIIDIPALSLVVDRRVHTMAKASLFRVPVVGWWLRKLDMFPVVRGQSDHRAFRHALEALRRGGILYMAPEGTRKASANGVERRAHTGAIRLAQLIRCPIVPVGITGTGRALPRGAWLPRPVRIRVRVGLPMQLPPVEVNKENRDILEHQARQVMNQVYTLVDDPDGR